MLRSARLKIRNPNYLKQSTSAIPQGQAEMFFQKHTDHEKGGQRECITYRRVREFMGVL